MSYQVLARKYRPKNFATLVGQEHVVRALSHALDQQRLHHAYLFTGTRGVGKTTLSRILAKSFNCEKGITSTPCGDCDTCVAIDAGRFVDYIEMDAASNRGVDEMAALLEQAVYAPSNARFKVYMIDEVHMLTNHAFNAMLKTLEEPPAHVKFILATTDPQKIPMTVLSRCLQFNLKQMPPGHIISHLDNILGQEHIEFETPALRLLAQGAHGSMRDALSLTDQAIAYAAGKVTLESVQSMLGALDQSYLIRLLDALAAQDGKAMLDVADEMAARSLSYKAALQDLGTLLNQMAIAQLAPTALGEELPERAQLLRLAGLFSKEEVQLFYQIVVHGRNEIGLAPDEYAGFTMSLLRMLAFRPSAISDQMGHSGEIGQAGQSNGLNAAKLAAKSANLVMSSAAAQMSAPVTKTHVTQTHQTHQTHQADSSELIPNIHVNVHTNIKEGHIVDSNAPNAPNDTNTTNKAVENTKPLSPAMAALAAARAGSNRALGRQSSVQSAAVPMGATKPEEAAFIAASSGSPSVATSVTTTVISATTLSTPPQRAPAPFRVANPIAAVQAKPVSKSEDDNMPPPWDDADFAAIAESATHYSSTIREEHQHFSGNELASPRQDAVRAVSSIISNSVSNSISNTSVAAATITVAVTESARVQIIEKMQTQTIAQPPINTHTSNIHLPKPDHQVEKVVIPCNLMPIKEINWDGHWPNLATSLMVRGVTQQLAQQSELKQCYVDGRAVVFKICVPVQTLALTGSVEKLLVALNEQFAEFSYEIRVETEFGAVEQTANAQAVADKAERLLKAEKNIQTDSFVQTLMRDFGASILTGSIKPI